MRQRGDDDFSTYGFNIYIPCIRKIKCFTKKKVEGNGKYKFPVEKFY